jgi:undecaprenyl-diphosphatase
MDFSIINEFILSLLVGAIQGATEFIPVSSTAHIRLLTGLLTKGRDIGLNSSNIIQLGTLAAVIKYFWSDLKRYYYRLKEIVLNQESRDIFVRNAKVWQQGHHEYKGEEETYTSDITIYQLAIGTIPIIVLYAVFGNFADTSRSLGDIALYLIAGSALMYFGEFMHAKVQKEHHVPKPPLLSIAEVLTVGFFQSLAIFPGISRSGATIAGALLLGRSRAQSVRFSFLLSIPAIFIGGLKGLFDYIQEFIQSPTIIPVSENWNRLEISLSLISLIGSAVAAYYVGLYCLKWLIGYLSNHPVQNFIYYRLGLAVLIIIFIQLIPNLV